MSARKRPGGVIDRDKLRTALRNLRHESLFHMLDAAIDLLPPGKMTKLVGAYLDMKELGPDAAGTRDLIADVRAFEAGSRAGRYYEGFKVNSKNFMEKSRGTRAFIDDCCRLLERCVTQSREGDAAEVLEALDLILGLLRDLDEGNDDIVFFADEAGLWQVGVEWAKVLPALFLCLSRTTEPDEYARRVVEAVDQFAGLDQDKHLSTARRLGTAAQRRACDEAMS